MIKQISVFFAAMISASQLVGQEMEPPASLAQQVLSFSNCGENDGLLSIQLTEGLSNNEREVLLAALHDRLPENSARQNVWYDAFELAVSGELIEKDPNGGGRILLRVPVGTTPVVAILLRESGLVTHADNWVGGCGGTQSEHYLYDFGDEELASNILSSEQELRDTAEAALNAAFATMDDAKQQPGIVDFTFSDASLEYQTNRVVFDVVAHSEKTRNRAGSWDRFEVTLYALRTLHANMHQLTFIIDINEVRTRRETVQGVRPTDSNIVDQLKISQRLKIVASVAAALEKELENRFP